MIQDNAQCSNCPFKKTSSTASIPDYNLQDHENSRDITLEEGEEFDLRKINEPFRTMACHGRNKKACIGWINHQMEVGNVGLRLSFGRGLYPNIKFPLVLDGKQVETFNETFKQIKFH